MPEADILLPKDMDDVRCVFDAEVVAKTQLYASKWRKVEENECLKCAEEASRQGDEGRDELEDAADGDADEAEWQQEDPYERVENQREQGEWPAEDEKQAPKKELNHGMPPPMTAYRRYLRKREVVGSCGSIGRPGEGDLRPDGPG